MNADLFKISLNQGKQFNKYQSKIKKNIVNNRLKKRSFKEGFVSAEQEMMLRPKDDGYVSVLQNNQSVTTLNNSVTQKDLDELKKLQSQYNDLVQQYTSIQKTIGDSSLETINRVSPSNPYLGKNIRFTTGHIAYVTNQGVVKYIPSPDIWTSVGISFDYIDVNIPWNDAWNNNPGLIIPTNPTLITGTFVQYGENLKNAGKNVYASRLIDNPSSSYVGCYNDKPPATDLVLVPVMGPTNEVNGFSAVASSIYQNNNDFAGPWCAFDNNVNTWWHSNTDSTFTYDANSGQYLGSNGINMIDSNGKSINIAGEWLQITFPNLNAVTKYSIQGRQGCCGQPNGRDPNTWYIVGLKDNQWYQVDYQTNISFNWNMLSFNISNPQPYISYAIITTVVGDSNATSGYRNCVQIATWNLIVSSDSTFTDDQRAMIFNPSVIGYTTIENCQQYAVDNGYQYFGMQDYRTDGTAACLVSNDITRSQMYGETSKQVTGYPIWSANTAGTDATSFTVTSDGRMMVVNSSNNVLWQSTNAPSDCWWGGKVNPDSIQGSYGGNCVGKPVNIDCGNPSPNQSYAPDGIVGNLNSLLKQKALDNTSNSSWSYNPMTEFTGGDPAYCCAKLVDYSYQCGGGSFKTGEIGGGSNINFDCSAEVTSCSFYVVLQDDGNVCLYRGPDPSVNNGTIWCTMTNGKQLSPNPDWIASKGKFGRNYLKSGETLAVGEWIGSTDGSLQLMMQPDGNLVLWTSDVKASCVKGSNDKTYGGPWVNAVYQLNGSGDMASLGKVGYVDSNAVLKEYPDSMLTYSNDYQIYPNSDSWGNDITSLIVSDQNGCQTACNNNADCAAYVYMPSATTCWIKNSSAFPKGQKQPNNNLVLGVRKPGLKGSSTCSNQIVDIDTIQYDKYVKGSAMSPDTQCVNKLVSQSDKIKFDNIKNQLYTLGQNIASKMENLYNKDNKIYEKLNTNDEQFKKDLQKYISTNLKIRKELEIQSNNNVEGMQNFTSSQNLNMNDIDGMLTDADLRVLQENYSYIMWSILAVGALTITVNLMKK